MSDQPASSPPPGGQFLVYQTADGKLKIDGRFEGETVWLTQQHMAELFQTTQQNVSLHLQNIYEEGELQRGATHKEFLSVRQEGARAVLRQVDFYNLDAIISVGYRVKSALATRFRIWATQRLREYIVKGFTMDDERLKNPPGPGHLDYFDELLERIRDIRASERRMYLRVREILALASDYQPSAPETLHVFKIVQNKLHFAATGKTAPELIAERADATQPNMGLTAWHSGIVRKGDETVAKNYLREGEITELNRIVVMFLDFAEDQAKRRKAIFLRTWQAKLDEFLRFNDRNVLADGGKITREQADTLADKEYERFAARRRVQFENEGEADTLKLLEDEVKKLPAPKKPKRPKS